jgi:hypothetical protein
MTVPDKSYHFKPKARIDHKKNKVGNLANINHRIKIVIAFDECEATCSP